MQSLCCQLSAAHEASCSILSSAAKKNHLLLKKGSFSEQLEVAHILQQNKFILPEQLNIAAHILLHWDRTQLIRAGAGAKCFEIKMDGYINGRVEQVRSRLMGQKKNAKKEYRSKNEKYAATEECVEKMECRTCGERSRSRGSSW